ALSDVRLTLRHGEVLALVGENGAGKSTLMKLLSGIHAPDAGRFTVDGQEVRITGPRHAQQLGISIIHQELNLMPDLTVAQNVLIGREPRRAGLFLDTAELDRRAREHLQRLGLPLDPRAVVGRLTVAQQQMVEIAKALSYEARILIMDEPTAALNHAEVQVLHDLIRRFTGPRTGVIYISHRMDELEAVSDRITVLRDGRYVDTRDTRSTTLREVISLMVGRPVDATTGRQPARAERPPVLQVRGLSTRALLREVTFDLHEGEILGFAGLMGAGRTEVARAIVGADRRSTGTVLLRGREVSVPNPARAARLGIGYLSEDRKGLGLLLERSIAENIALSSLRDRFSTAGFVRERTLRSTVRQQIDALRIRTPSPERRVKDLSGGNQQKVALAKWLVKDCDVLVVDEPTRGIDVGAKEEIYAILDALAAQGKSIIMISSELPEVLRMSHRIAVMNEGRITGFLEGRSATQEDVMHLATLRPPGAGAGAPLPAPVPTTPTRAGRQ
ncbi:sugar ABC transporter ATP-binding protein, partial [Kineococcus glutinatus]|uniref:sugar ABC transporter ATP-binding protein n=1 Tax=Kineococcus glutinatus TaxID=1070872 RepID=UPI0031ECDA62